MVPEGNATSAAEALNKFKLRAPKWGPASFESALNSSKRTSTGRVASAVLEFAGDTARCTEASRSRDRRLPVFRE